MVQKEARARPLDEQAQADLMRCYMALGRRAEAFAVFEATRRRLVAELGVDPNAMLTDAYRELLEPERYALAASRPALSPVTPNGSSTEAPTRQPVCWPICRPTRSPSSAEASNCGGSTRW